jgi:uncharacterized protein YggU (UPF0235/DUF167 family)
VARSAIALEAGHSGRNKLVTVAGVTAEEVARRLGV